MKVWWVLVEMNEPRLDNFVKSFHTLDEALEYVDSKLSGQAYRVIDISDRL